MRAYDFDRKVFDNQWAFPFTVLQYTFLIGFVLMCIAVALGAITDIHVTVPTPVAWLLCISFVGFPIVTVVKVGYSRLLRWSELKERDGRICYDRVVQAEYTATGRSEEYNIYEVRKLTSTRMTKRYLIIEGDIRKAVVSFDEKMVFSEIISSVKIPRAYEDMELLARIPNQ